MHAKYIVETVEMMRERTTRLIDVTKASEDEYVEHCAEMDILSAPLRDCFSYYNGNGKSKLECQIGQSEEMAEPIPFLDPDEANIVVVTLSLDCTCL